MRTRAVILPLGVIGLVAAAAAVLAGPLNPPAGPVGPTYKTLAEVEPRIAINATNTPGDADSLFRITQPGSYYLTGNLTGVAGKAGIEVAASGVTIDLQGFEMKGVSGALAGIFVTNSTARGVCVQNGTLREWPLQGIDARFAWSGRYQRLRLLRNFQGGIVAGSNSDVSDCTADDNWVVGIEVFGDSVVRNCTVVRNTTGIKAEFGALIESNTVNTHGGNGIIAGSSNRIIGNLCGSNGNGAGDGAGIHVVGAGNHIEGNTVSANDRGIDVDVAGNFIARNTARNNSTAFAITGTQTIGPIISATGTISSNNPWANFAY